MRLCCAPSLANNFGRGWAAMSEQLLDLVSVPLASYHPSTFFWLASLSLELHAEKMHWGVRGRWRQWAWWLVSRRREGEAETPWGRCHLPSKLTSAYDSIGF